MGLFWDNFGIRPWFLLTLVFSWLPPMLLGLLLVGECGGSNGRHTCYITSVEDAVNVTWDSTLVYTKTDPQASNEDKFCVVDSRVREQLDLAAKKRARVTIHYQNDLILWRWECNGGDSIIVGVEEDDEDSADPVPSADDPPPLRSCFGEWEVYDTDHGTVCKKRTRN